MTMTTSRSPRDSATPSPVTGGTIVDVFKETARTHCGRPALRWREGAVWRSLSWAQYEQSVTAVANALRNWGLVPGDRVGILATNRPEWHIADIATMAAGLVSVPIYPSNAASQVRYVLGHSGARVCFVENVDQLAKVLLRRDELPDLEHVVVIDDVNGLDDGFVTCFDDLRASVASGGSMPDNLDELIDAVTPSDSGNARLHERHDRAAKGHDDHPRQRHGDDAQPDVVDRHPI